MYNYSWGSLLKLIKYARDLLTFETPEKVLEQAREQC